MDSTTSILLKVPVFGQNEANALTYRCTKLHQSRFLGKKSDKK